MTTLALTYPQFAPAVQDARVGTCIRRVLAATLIVVGVLLTLVILSKLGPLVYGIPMPLMRRAMKAEPVAA